MGTETSPPPTSSTREEAAAVLSFTSMVEDITICRCAARTFPMFRLQPGRSCSLAAEATSALPPTALSGGGSGLSEADLRPEPDVELLRGWRVESSWALRAPASPSEPRHNLL